MRGLRAGTLGVITALAAGCGGSAPDSFANRIVVHDDAGSIRTVLPDGSDPRTIAPAAEGIGLHQQPTWSPTGDRIAWVDVTVAGVSVRVADPMGEELVAFETATPPFYLMWGPDGSALVGLAPSDAGIDVVIFDLEDGGSRVLDGGQPYYLDWAPDGSGLLTHVGVTGLDELSIEGVVTDLDREAGLFQAPQWDGDGTRVYAVADTDGQVVVVEKEGLEPRSVLEYRGLIFFDLAGDRLAYLAVSLEGAGGAPDVVPASFGGPASGRDRTLTVLDLDDGAQHPVTFDQVVAFHWSPDGRKLLFLSVVEGDPLLRTWSVWEDGEVSVFHPHVPSFLYLTRYQPFFDQYDRSQTMWSPESDAFVYAGTDVAGSSGVWVQPLSGERQFIGEGEFASWAPAGR